jgi:hypothetical protein
MFLRKVAKLLPHYTASHPRTVVFTFTAVTASDLTEGCWCVRMRRFVSSTKHEMCPLLHTSRVTTVATVLFLFLNSSFHV